MEKIFRVSLRWIFLVVGVFVFFGCQADREDERIEASIEELEADASRWNDVPIEVPWHIDEGLTLTGVLEEIREEEGYPVAVLGLIDGSNAEVPMDMLPAQEQLLAWRWALELDLCPPVGWLRIPVFSPGMVDLIEVLDAWEASVITQRSELMENPVRVRILEFDFDEMPKVPAMHWFGLNAIEILDLMCNTIEPSGRYDWVYRGEEREIVIGGRRSLISYPEYAEKEMRLRRHEETIEPLLVELGLDGAGSHSGHRH